MKSFGIIAFDEDDEHYKDYFSNIKSRDSMGTFKANNISGTKYYKKYPVEESTGFIPGQEAYGYSFITEGGVVILVTYNRFTANQFNSFEKDDEDILGIVEETITTLHVN